MSSTAQKNVMVTASGQVWLHGTQNATSHWNLLLLMKPRRRGVNCLCCVPQHTRSLTWNNKKSQETFSSVKMMTSVQCDWFCKLHGTFDARKHLSRGKSLNRSDKRNRWEYLNHSSTLILNCRGKGGLSSTTLGSVIKETLLPDQVRKYVDFRYDIFSVVDWYEILWVG